MIKELAKLATKLDRLGLTKEADVLDAALNKLAQAAATTGVPGARYQAGEQVTPGYPGGPTQKFYRSKPKSLSEFNAYLGAVIKNTAADPRQRAFSSAVINNLPTSADSTWTPKTQAAFKEYAVAAGFPEAGINWEAFAKSHNYEPTLNGVYRFWEDTIAEVDPEARLEKTLQGLKESPSDSGSVTPTTSGATGTQKGTLPAATQIRLEQIQDTARRIVEERS